MELLVATWSLRIAVIAALVVGGISLSVGASVLETAQRALFAVFFFTLAGRLVVGWLEPPERKLQRLQARAAKRAGKGGGKTAKPAKGSDNRQPDAAAAAAGSRAA